MGYLISVSTFVAIYLLGVLSTFLLTGLTGLFSFGQAAFMAIGAYVSGLLAVKSHLPFAAAFVLGIAVAALVAWGIGVITLRLGRDYFALATFVFGEAVKGLVNVGIGVTGGALGLVGIPMHTKWWGAAGVAILCIWLVANLKRSRLGLTAVTIREDEVAAQTMGVDVYRHRLRTFVLSAGIAAAAGVLLAFMTTYIEPNMFNWTRSAEWIIIVFFGGRNSLLGAVVAGVLLLSFPEFARFGGEWRMVIYSVIVLLIINFLPEGLFGGRELSLRGFRKARRCPAAVGR